MVNSSPRNRGPSAASGLDADQASSDGDFLTAVDRAMRILEILADQEDGVSTSEIARRLDVNKQIAVRILHTLLQGGYVFQTPKQLYKLTYKIGNLGFRQQSTAKLTDQCVPLIEALARETGELVRLAVMEDGYPIWLHAAVGRNRTLRLDPTWPANVILHAHAVGKVVLASMSDEAAVAALGPEPFSRETSRTLTDVDSVMRDVRQAREIGYALSCEEAEDGIVTIAAPVGAGPARKLVAVVSVAAPTARVSCDELPRFAPSVLAVTARMADVWPLWAG
jgi:IclR family acetate operon transcriptional repressor